MLESVEACVDPWQEMGKVKPGQAEWKIGRDGIQVEDLRLGALEQVGNGSWQVRLFYKPTR